MKKNIILLIFIITNCLIWGKDINKYQQIEICKLKIGENSGEIGYDGKRAQMGAPPGATAFSIDHNTSLYICDSINNRINIYNSNFDLIQEIKPEKKYSVRFSYVMRVDSNNIILLNGDMNLLKINRKGELLFEIENRNLVSDITGKYNFFPYEDKVYFYDYKSNEKIKFYDSKGKVLDNIKSNDIISKTKKSIINLYSNFDQSSNIQFKINNIIETKKLFFDKALLTTDFNMHRDYYKKLKGMQFNTSNKRSKVEDIEFDLLNIGIGRHYIGVDSDYNSYWQCDRKDDNIKTVIIILSPYGEILDVFYNNLKWSLVAVAPSGDVYFLSYMYKSEYVHFHKTIRVW